MRSGPILRDAGGDAFAAELGGIPENAQHRSWFVPEDFQFRRGGELLEYARLVSLANYLKQQGVPLHWFLMAHRHLILTEEAPLHLACVAKRSDYVRGLLSKGGVDLAVTPSVRGDAEVEAAIREALKTPHEAALPLAAGSTSASWFSAGRQVTLDLEGTSYTIHPQQSLSSGRDRNGNRYQTDFNSGNGQRLGLELVRYYNLRGEGRGHFGQDWRLLIPYRLKPADRETTQH